MQGKGWPGALLDPSIKVKQIEKRVKAQAQIDLLSNLRCNQPYPHDPVTKAVIFLLENMKC